MRFPRLAVLATISVLLAPGLARAGETLVAVAANYTAPVKEIAAAFEKKTGDKVNFAFGSTGQLYTQITQGAPFEAFFAADDERPVQAEAEGFGVPGSSFTYAVGTLVLWSAKPGLVDAKGEVLKSGGFAKLAIANPKGAPYGAAAVETLKKLGLYETLEPKIVQGNNISQAHQFVATGNAEIGFVALSQVALDPAGSRWVVPQALYTPIHQDAVLLKKGAANPVASAFLAFQKSPEALAVLKKYGYGVRK